VSVKRWTAGRHSLLSHGNSCWPGRRVARGRRGGRLTQSDHRRRKTATPSGPRRARFGPLSGPAWSTFGPHAIGTQRFPTVSSGTSFAQATDAILGKQALGRTLIRPPWPGAATRDENRVARPCSALLGAAEPVATRAIFRFRMRSARQSVIHRPCRTGPPAAAPGGPDLPGDDASDAGRRHRRTGRWIGLQNRLLPICCPRRAIRGRSTAERVVDLGWS